MSAGYDLKSEEDIKEYTNNLGVEYRFSCYSEKRPDGCHLLGDYLDSIKKDYEKAIKVYKLNCDEHSFAKSCYKYAAYRHLGRASTKDSDEAFKYFEKGCNLDEPQSCLLAGVLATSSTAAETNKEGTTASSKLEGRDFVQGMSFLNKSCLANNAEACHRASSMYIVGHEKLAKDMKKAFEYATRACQLGHAHSCANLSLMYLKGEGTAKNSTLADRFKKLAIEIQEQHIKAFKQIEFGK